MGDQTRSAETQSSLSQDAISGPWIERIGNSGDLTGLGITINRYLKGWTEDDCLLTVCIDSLTAIL